MQKWLKFGRSHRDGFFWCRVTHRSRFDLSSCTLRPETGETLFASLPGRCAHSDSLGMSVAVCHEVVSSSYPLQLYEDVPCLNSGVDQLGFGIHDCVVMDCCDGVPTHSSC